MKRRPDTSTARRQPVRLEICPSCERDYVQPVSWEPAGEDRWWMFLRCAECDASRDVIVSNRDAERFETALHARATVLSRSLRELESEQMAAEAEVFVAALQRDLIDAGDFAR